MTPLTPTQSVTLLGFNLNSVSYRATLSEQRGESLGNSVNLLHLGKTVSFQPCLRLLGLMASVIAVVPLGLLLMRDFQRWTASLKLNPSRHLHRRVCISAQYLKALHIWRDRTFLTEGVPMGVVSNHKVVTTDTSSLGWGAIMERQPVNGV